MPLSGPKGINEYVSVCKCSTLDKRGPGHLKTKKMCDEVVTMKPYSLEFVPGHLKTEEMCKGAVSNKVYTMRYVLDYLKRQEMCEK